MSLVTCARRMPCKGPTPLLKISTPNFRPPPPLPTTPWGDSDFMPGGHKVRAPPTCQFDGFAITISNCLQSRPVDEGRCPPAGVDRRASTGFNKQARLSERVHQRALSNGVDWQAGEGI